MKGVISTGLVMPAMALEYMDIDTSLLENNQSFDTVNGIQVCFRILSKHNLIAFVAISLSFSKLYLFFNIA